MRFLKIVLATASLAAASQAGAVMLTGGQTNVALDTEILSSVGLDLSGVAGPVIVPGNLGAASVAFPITAATTFDYTAGSLAPFSGTIEHSGSVLFNDGGLEVGNFTIGFDAGRQSATTSGFFVADNITFPGVALFDIGPPSTLDATDMMLTVGADLLVSPELAGVLEDTALIGVDVGDALVEGTAGSVAVSEPGTLALMLSGLALAGFARRRATRLTQAA